MDLDDFTRYIILRGSGWYQIFHIFFNMNLYLIEMIIIKNVFAYIHFSIHINNPNINIYIDGLADMKIIIWIF